MATPQAAVDSNEVYYHTYAEKEKLDSVIMTEEILNELRAARSNVPLCPKCKNALTDISTIGDEYKQYKCLNCNFPDQKKSNNERKRNED